MNNYHQCDCVYIKVHVDLVRHTHFFPFQELGLYTFTIWVEPWKSVIFCNQWL